MREATPHHPTKILSLSLVFLLTGLLGCSHGSQGEQPAAGAKAAPAASAPVSATTPAAGTAGSTGGTAAPAPTGGMSAAPGTLAPGQAPQEPALAPEKIPDPVAKVNGAPVAKAELIKTATQVHSQMMPNAPQTADFYRKVLDNLIARTLLLQEAKAAGIVATDAEINKQIADLKGRFPTPEKFQEELKSEGMTEAELTQRARDAYMVQKFIETKVVNDVKVSDEDIKAFYDKNQDQMKRPEREHLRHILIKVAKGASAEDKAKAKAKADSILVKLKAGGDFAKLAEENSDDPGSKTKGGDLGFIAKGQTVKPFEDAAFALKKPNELSPVVESDFGFHIIQLVEHQDAGVIPLPEVKDRIGEFLKQKQQQDKVQDHVKAQRAKSKVEVFI